MSHSRRQHAAEHKEAVRLAWLSRHIPLGSLLIGSFIAVIFASAVLTILAQGPSNPIP
jgi:hypothetical protein